MVRTTFLTVFIIVWMLVAAYVGVVALLSIFRRSRQVSASSPGVLPTGLASSSRGPIGG